MLESNRAVFLFSRSILFAGFVVSFGVTAIAQDCEVLSANTYTIGGNSGTLVGGNQVAMDAPVTCTQFSVTNKSGGGAIKVTVTAEQADGRKISKSIAIPRTQSGGTASGKSCFGIQPIVDLTCQFGR